MLGEQDPRFAAHRRDDSAQSLNQHLMNVARIASRLAGKFGAAELGYWAGIWHDVGKFNSAFQAYLFNGGGSAGPDHKAAGTLLALEHFSPLCFVIAGHHGGIPSLVQLKSWLTRKRTDPTVQATLRSAAAEGPELNPRKPLHGPKWLKKGQEHQIELFIRMLFSTLVDADHCDTGRYMDGHAARQDTHSQAASQALGKYTRYLDLPRASKSSEIPPDTRDVEKEMCRSAAGKEQGVFFLRADNGNVGTELALEFGLRHAMHHRLDRIIFSVPPAMVRQRLVQLHRTLGGCCDPSKAGTSEVRQGVALFNLRSYLIEENWGTPIVVTSSETLFRTMCSNLPGTCRKLHNLARSVLVIHDHHALPTGILEPIDALLRELVEHYRVTLVYQGAEAPTWAELKGAKRSKVLRHVLPHSTSLDATSAIESLAEPISWSALGKLLLSNHQSMTIVNTRRDALRLFETMKGDGIFHLSSSMCMAHRQSVASAIQARLDCGSPCHVIATAMAEFRKVLAFPTVYRAIAPMDRVIGCITRMRQRNIAPAKITFFDPSEAQQIRGAYRSATVLTKNLLGKLNRTVALSELAGQYFEQIPNLVQSDWNRSLRLRAEFDFPAVANRTMLREVDTLTLVVPYRPAGSQQSPAVSIIGKIRCGSESPHELARLLTSYVVEVYSSKLTQFVRQVTAHQIIPGLWEWLGPYDSETGIVMDRTPFPETLKENSPDVVQRAA